MLVLTRKIGESFVIDGNIKITIVDIGLKKTDGVKCGRGKVRVGIDAPLDVKVLRTELMPTEPPATE